jgi:peptide/nickel transport system substrate-binding protein
VFGIRPRAYDDGWQFGDRPDYFGEARVRQALTHCMDRQQVLDRLLAGQSGLSDSYLPPGHPLSDPQAVPLAFDPQAGAALLEEAGWLDEDGDPATPRLYRGEDLEIPQGTPFVFRFWTSEAPQRRQAAEILADSLAGCGVQAEVQVWPADELYASGPEGPLFGRDFDLAQLAWQVGVRPPCQLFLGEAVPGDPTLLDENGDILFPYGWGGWNPTGYANPAFDTACQSARASLPGQIAYRQNHLEAQALFAQDLPAVPLFYHLQVAAARPDLCGFSLQAGDSGLLWNLESLDYGEGCQDLE